MFLPLYQMYYNSKCDIKVAKNDEKCSSFKTNDIVALRPLLELIPTVHTSSAVVGGRMKVSFWKLRLLYKYF